MSARTNTTEPGRQIDEQAHAVIGAAIEVHRHLGPGYLESVYQAAMTVELRLRGLPFTAQKPISVRYKDHEIGEGRLDFWVGEGLIVELKAVDALAPVHKAQVLVLPQGHGAATGATHQLQCDLAQGWHSARRAIS